LFCCLIKNRGNFVFPLVFPHTHYTSGSQPVRRGTPVHRELLSSVLRGSV